MRTFKCIKDLGWGILILADLILLQMCPKNKHKNNNATSKKISPYCARHKPNNWQHPTNTRELELSSKKAGNMGLTFMFYSRVSKYQEFFFIFEHFVIKYSYTYQHVCFLETWKKCCLLKY